jgi:hypothetical protein
MAERPFSSSPPLLILTGRLDLEAASIAALRLPCMVVAGNNAVLVECTVDALRALLDALEAKRSSLVLREVQADGNLLLAAFTPETKAECTERVQRQALEAEQAERDRRAARDARLRGES